MITISSICMTCDARLNHADPDGDRATRFVEDAARRANWRELPESDRRRHSTWICAACAAEIGGALDQARADAIVARTKAEMERDQLRARLALAKVFLLPGGTAIAQQPTHDPADRKWYVSRCSPARVLCDDGKWRPAPHPRGRHDDAESAFATLARYEPELVQDPLAQPGSDGSERR